MRPGLDNRFLQVGPSSGPRLPREDRAGWHHIGGHHIGGQDVELTLYRRHVYRIVFRTRFLNFRCAFELYHLYLNLLCKTRVVN